MPNKKIFFAFIWKFMERFSVLAVGTMISIILARMLMPRDFGGVAILMIFINLAQIFVVAGFNTALIQKKDADEKDFSTVTVFSLASSLVLYCITWGISPWFTRWVNIPELVMPMRVLGLVLFTNAVAAVQIAYATKKMNFRNMCAAQLLASLVGGVTGIVMAYYGFGVWAIVWHTIAHSIASVLFLFVFIPWLPGFTFCKDRFSRLFSFGSKILCSSLLVALFLDIRGIFIGKTGTPSDLAFFDRGKLFPTTFVGTIGTVIQSVLLPVFSEHQDDSVALKQMVRQGIRRAMFLIVPILLILIGVGRPFIGFLLTEKWLPAVFFLNCFAITYLFHPPQYIAVEAIKAKGLSSQILYIEILRKVVEFVTLIAAIPFGCRAIALTAVLSGAVSLAIMFPFNKRYLGYTHTEQLCDIFSIVLPGCIMLACLLFCDAKIVDFPGKWVALGATGVIVYMAIMLLFRNSVANEIMQICKRYLRTRHTC